MKRTPGEDLGIQTIKTSNDLYSLFTKVAGIDATGTLL
jgi:hypothetical protein